MPQQWGPPTGGFPGPGGPGGYPPGAGGPPPPLGGGKPKRSHARVWIAVGVVALLVVGAGAWFVFGGAASAQAAQVQLEATSTAGPSPFTTPVGEDTSGVVAPANAQGAQPGNTGGLYAQDPAKASCDTASLVNQLGADPSKSAAWGKSLGIDGNSVGGFVNTLAAVTLRADTNVTEYGYGDSQFQPYPATLQAGTAVLVNSYGEPTVKCYNGDPLGPPTDSNNSGTYVGAPWNGWAAERTIIVTPAPAPIIQIVVVNPGTNTQGSKPMPPNPDPKKNPGPPTTSGGQLLLTGTHNYDGTVTLSDGRILGVDGKILPPRVNATFPPGTTTLPDGGHKLPNGVVLNIDGTTRNPVTVGGVTIQPDGSTQVLPDGRIVHFNYDGTILIVKPGAGGGVAVLNPDGTTKSLGGVVAGIVVNPDGSFTTPDGKIHNADGSVRAPQTLPDGTILDPTGGNTPPGDAKVDKTMQGTDGTLGTENKLLKAQEEGQIGPAQPGADGQGTNGQPGQSGQTVCTPTGTPTKPGTPVCPAVPEKTVCVPGTAATPVCPAVPDKSKKGSSTAGSSTSGSGTGSGSSTSGSGSGSGSGSSGGGSGSGSGSSGSGSSSGGSGGGSSSGG